ncbi:MAG: tRNA (adenosine(37)-N6)-threonylcarbamoyltransferase complex ATPase subunit type 1 TsaE [bacterium]|jgi:tRNA threonylcarbamoyladenosine biosynthesis protein TsaE|nr:tRNA (adenosine(37)-N6)-threonylcarbamoyltransferase complex ATPase subunit type 1 TsaE [Planctomycetota bacterium]HIL51120.1 tRNA (adenosine(37)-N6)-threonylcarbamoyltransferase complex ATPase subunit type 1 TsaE [Planctomycetota bacterium]
MASEARAVFEFFSRGPDQTEALGAALGRLAWAGLVIALEGELGAGKTCFVRGLASGLEIEEPVTSPSFALMHEYKGRLGLLHFDAWMEGRERALLADGGDELLGSDAVCAIEWGERVQAALPEPYLRLLLTHESPTSRRLWFEVVGQGTGSQPVETLLAKLREAPEASQA